MAAATGIERPHAHSRRPKSLVKLAKLAVRRAGNLPSYRGLDSFCL
jgi:hypothetical protein